MTLLSKLGLSSAAVGSLSKAALAETSGDPRKDVPIVETYKHTNHREITEGRAPPEREIRHTTVPRDRWVMLEGARKARYQVAQRFEGQPQITVGITYDNPGKNPEPRVVVNLNKIAKRQGPDPEAQPLEIVERPGITKDTARSRAPGSVVASVGNRGFERETDPIPVTVEENTRVEQAYFDDTYRPVPAGVACDMYWGNPNGSVATATYSSDVGDWGWATAGHVVEWDTGTTMDQPDTRIGESEGPILGSQNGMYKRDAAFVSEDGPPYASYGIADDNGGERNFDVFGSVAEDKLHDLEASGDTVHFQGPMTGNQSSTIEQLEGDGSITYDTRVVELANISSKNGDSGCTYYWKKNSSEAYIVGVHAWGRDEDNDGFVDTAEGNTMEYVEGTLDLFV